MWKMQKKSLERNLLSHIYAEHHPWQGGGDKSAGTNFYGASWIHHSHVLFVQCSAF